MRSQPIQPKRTAPGTLWQTFLARIPRKTLSPALALLPYPGTPIGQIPLATESTLVIALACLAGLLGFSAALLYRHMHTEEEKLRGRVENGEAELQALLAMTDDAVLILNGDGTIRDANPATEELFGVSGDDLPGSPLTDLIAQPLCLGELAKHGPVSFQITAKRPGGGFPNVEMALSPIEIAGKCTYLALVRDSQPAESASDASSSKLAKSIERFTHDLNNELTTVIGNLSLLLMSSPSDPANHERIVSAKRTAIRAHTLTNQFQSLTSDASPELESPTEDRATTQTIISMPDPVLAPQSKEIPPVTPADPRTPRILVLDDEEAICALISTALDSMGFEVTEALSVAPALHACEEAVKEGRPYDLVISDLSLPGDMNGIDAVNRLRSIDPRIQAIVSTGYSADPIMSDCRRHGFAAAIAKPYDLGKLGRVVREVLASGSSTIFKTA